MAQVDDRRTPAKSREMLTCQGTIISFVDFYRADHPAEGDGELTEQTEKFRFVNDEVISFQTNVDTLVRDMERAIAQADAFIASLRAE